MRGSSKIDSTEFTGLNRVIGWYAGQRWVAAAMVFMALATARYLLHYRLPYPILAMLGGLLVAVNLGLTFYHYGFRHQNLSRREMSVLFHVQIATDYALLFLLVYFSGNLENPFIFFFVFHIMLTSFIFSRAVVLGYAVALVVCLTISFVAEAAGLLPHYPLNPGSFDPAAYRGALLVRAVGLFTTLVVSAYMVTSIKSRIEERGRRVEVELARYRDLDRAKSDFILQVTHELRGPLAALTGYHEMMLKGITGGISDQARETILKANRRTENLLTMIDEMIDFAYMKSSRQAASEKRLLPLKETIDYNLELFLTRAAEKSIALVSSCGRDVSVWAARDLLNILLGNLIVNAIKYSPPGTTVTVNAANEDPWVHLLVKDEGIGIEPEELERIFDEFYRTQRARRLERDGTGLGLPIVKRAVDALDGRISVYSESDKGTTFHVYLPQEGRNA